MATKIVTKNSSTASAVPTASDLVQGELAVNVTDGKLYTENASAAIVELGAKWGATQSLQLLQEQTRTLSTLGLNREYLYRRY